MICPTWPGVLCFSRPMCSCPSRASFPTRFLASCFTCFSVSCAPHVSALGPLLLHVPCTLLALLSHGLVLYMLLCLICFFDSHVPPGSYFTCSMSNFIFCALVFPCFKCLFYCLFPTCEFFVTSSKNQTRTGNFKQLSFHTTWSC